MLRLSEFFGKSEVAIPDSVLLALRRLTIALRFGTRQRQGLAITCSISFLDETRVHSSQRF